MKGVSFSPSHRCVDRKPIPVDILTCFGKQNSTAAEVTRAAAAAAVAAGAGRRGKEGEADDRWGGGLGGGHGEGYGGLCSGGGFLGVMDRLGPVFSSGRDLRCA